MMKILVAVKRVVDYKVVVRLKADHSDVETANVKMSMNPFDEIALEEAIRLKEKGQATEVIAASIGNSACQETLRTALAMGADRAILIKTEAFIHPLAAAKILKFLVERNQPSLVILGKQAIDTDDNQVGQMLAGLLNWPQGTFVSKLVVNKENLEIVREVDGGLETLCLKIPAVITTDLRLNEPRYLSLPNIVKAKTKPLDIIELSTLAINTESKLKLTNMAIPEKRRAGIKLESVKELIDHLKNEAQVL